MQEKKYKLAFSFLNAVELMSVCLRKCCVRSLVQVSVL